MLGSSKWTYEYPTKHTKQRGGGYLLQYATSPSTFAKLPCDFTPLEAHDDVFQIETFLRDHMYDTHLTYMQDRRDGKTASGTFNRVDFTSCGNRPYVLRRLKNRNKDTDVEADALLHTLSSSHAFFLPKSELKEYLRELQYQAYLSNSKDALAPKVYMVGCLKRSNDFFEVFCMMEPKKPVSDKDELTRKDLDSIETLYGAIAAYTAPLRGVTFIDLKVENLVWSTNGFQAIDFGMDFAIVDPGVSSAVRADVMCYLFYMHLLAFWSHKLKAMTKVHARARVHKLLEKRDVVQTMWRWYLTKEPFRRIINCYSLDCCGPDPATQAFLQRLYHNADVDIDALPASVQQAVDHLRTHQLSFFPQLSSDPARTRFLNWREHGEDADAMVYASVDSGRLDSTEEPNQPQRMKRKKSPTQSEEVRSRRRSPTAKPTRKRGKR